MGNTGSFSARGTKEDIETGNQFMPLFNSNGLIPVVTTDHKSGAVLMVAYMNAEALQATLNSGDATYWSRSRQELWRKGETSGNTQKVVAIRTDCDQDTLLLEVEQTGGACHLGYQSCFYREVSSDGALKVVGTKP